MENAVKRWDALPYGLRFAVRQITATVLGVLFAQTRLFGFLPTFAIALTAAAPKDTLLSACLGAAAGSVLFAQSLQAALVGAAAAAACGMIRFALDTVTQTSVSARAAAATAFLCCAAAGTTTLLAGGFYLSGVLQFVCDGILTASAAWIFHRAYSSGLLLRQSVVPNGTQAVPAAAALSILLLSLCFVHVYVFIPARFLASCLILLSAYVFAEQGGAAAGIFCGVTMEVACDTPYLACCWALGGLLAGLCGRRSRYWIPATLAFTAFAFALLAQTRESVAVFAETSAAGALFCLTPKKLLEHLRVESPAVTAAPGQDATLRDSLKKTAAAASQIAPYLARQQLQQGTVPGTKRMTERVRLLACEDCAGSALCWGAKQTETETALAACFRNIYRSRSLSPDTLPDPLRLACVRRNHLCASCIQAYEEYARVPMEAETAQWLSGDPFSAAAELLKDAAGCDGGQRIVKPRESENALHLLRTFGVPAHSASCFVQDGRTFVTARAKPCTQTIRKSALSSQLGKLCGCSLSMPTVTANGDAFVWTFSQSQRFRLRTGTAQHASDGRRCGDFFMTFAQNGTQTFLLSDGMGTGAEAQLDAQATVEIFASLLRAGISADCALHMVNTALLLREDVESAATLDMVQIDLFTGKTIIRKAGAAPTFLLHDGKTERIESPCMPVGILPQAHFACTERTVGKGDVLLMVTDGVCAAQDLAIRFSLGRHADGSAKTLARAVLARAVPQAEGAHTDDATVLAIIVE